MNENQTKTGKDSSGRDLPNRIADDRNVYAPVSLTDEQLVQLVGHFADTGGHEAENLKRWESR